MPVVAPRRLFTVDEFYQMAEAGILREDDRVELLEGEIVEMTPIGSRHAASVTRLHRSLERSVGPQYLVRVQNPVRLSDYSEPQPDIVVVKARDDFYRDAHPGPADVLLLVEVADTSAAIDRADKIPLYARGGIAEVWIADLAARKIDVYRTPTGSGYADHQVVGPGGRLSPSMLPFVQLAADELLL